MIQKSKSKIVFFFLFDLIWFDLDLDLDLEVWEETGDPGVNPRLHREKLLTATRVCLFVGSRPHAAVRPL